jgi:sulfur-carrier protein
MNVKVFADFREICGEKVIRMDIAEKQPVINILRELIQLHPALEQELLTDDEQLRPLVHVFVNGKNIVHAQGLQTVAGPNDDVALFPPVAGG